MVTEEKTLKAICKNCGRKLAKANNRGYYHLAGSGPQCNEIVPVFLAHRIRTQKVLSAKSNMYDYVNVFCSCGFETTLDDEGEVKPSIAEHKLEALIEVVGMEFDFEELPAREE